MNRNLYYSNNIKKIFGGNNNQSFLSKIIMNISGIILTFCVTSGIISIIISIVRAQERKKKIKEIVKYRYIPRTFEENYDDPISIDDIYDNISKRQSPWINSAIDLINKDNNKIAEVIIENS